MTQGSKRIRTSGGKRSKHMLLTLVVALAMLAAACSSSTTDTTEAGGTTAAPDTTEAVATTVAATDTTSGAAELSGTLVVASRGGSVGEAEKEIIWDPFGAESGVEVIQLEDADTDADLAAQCEANNYKLDYTITTPSGLKTLSEDGCLLEIDYTQFSEAAQSVIAGMPVSAVSPYGLAISTVGVNLAGSTESFPDGSGPQTWADFWDVETFPGGRAMPAFPFFSLEIALLADGVAGEDLYPIDWDRAFAKLEEIRPSIVKWWESGAEAPQLLIDGEVAASVAYNGRVDTVVEEGAPVYYTWDGALSYHDFGIIPIGAPNQAAALASLDFQFQPQVAADISTVTRYPVPSLVVWEAAPEGARDRWPSSPENRDALVDMDWLWWAEPSEADPSLTNEEYGFELMNAFIAGG